ncbi:MAG: ABC transporter ATP-binding protein, partial [Dehalococcoidia bacterium]|nr:ABC transporter ATP-binding protein [Dehalococcoidia bacterium]
MLALAGLVTLSVSLIALLPPYLAKLVFDRGVATGDIGTIVLYGLLAIGAFLLSSVLGFAGDALSAVVGTRFIVNVKSQAVQRLLQMRLEFFDKHQSGYLAERLSEVQMLGQFVSPMIFQFLGTLIQFIGALVIMARISVEITIVPLLFVVPFYFITRKMSGSLKETSEELMETGAQMMGSLQEMIGGVAEVKQSTAEE